MCNSFTVALFTLFLSSKKLEFCKLSMSYNIRRSWDMPLRFDRCNTLCPTKSVGRCMQTCLPEVHSNCVGRWDNLFPLLRWPTHEGKQIAGAAMSSLHPGIDRLLAGHYPGIETLRAIPNWKLTKVEVKRFSSSHR